METIDHVIEAQDGIQTQALVVEVDGEVVEMSIPDRIMANIHARSELHRGRC